MAFLLYEKKDGYLVNTGTHYSLAGYNLIYKLWKKHGSPINQGWEMSVDELIKEYTSEKGSMYTHSLLIDFAPKSSERIGIIEILNIYAYTYARENDNTMVADWTPMMLKLRDVFYEEYESKISKEEKDNE